MNKVIWVKVVIEYIVQTVRELLAVSLMSRSPAKAFNSLGTGQSSHTRWETSVNLSYVVFFVF